MKKTRKLKRVLSFGMAAVLAALAALAALVAPAAPVVLAAARRLTRSGTRARIS